jgi:hypothetical protein
VFGKQSKPQTKENPKRKPAAFDTSLLPDCADRAPRGVAERLKQSQVVAMMPQSATRREATTDSPILNFGDTKCLYY